MGMEAPPIPKWQDILCSSRTAIVELAREYNTGGIKPKVWNNMKKREVCMETKDLPFDAPAQWYGKVVHGPGGAMQPAGVGEDTDHTFYFFIEPQDPKSYIKAKP